MKMNKNDTGFYHYHINTVLQDDSHITNIVRQSNLCPNVYRIILKVILSHILKGNIGIH